ncbi:MAG TPA: hypothetical protein VL947_08230 [Cytophagales bacterium]|nr:hypothetical protein [Cytophagales bacterium]
MAKKKENPNKKLPKVHPDLQGLDMTINNFGEIKSNMDIDKLNEFLNKTVDDKKLRKKGDKDK